MTRKEKDLEIMFREELIIFNLEEKMISASLYLKSCNEQIEVDQFHVGF